MPDELSIAGRSIASLCDDVASSERGMGAGVVCATTCALAASLVALVARSSPDWDEAAGVAAQALVLATRAQEAADAGAAAFADALAALDTARSGGEGALGPVLERAGDVPEQIVALAADVCELAAVAARNGAADRRADAAVAATLAEADARGGAALVAINLVIGADDERLAGVRRHVAAAEAAHAAAAAAVA